MHLEESKYKEAYTDFFEAFKNYDESGSARRTTCLKYLVLANILMESNLNPFDLQELQSHENDPEIKVMKDLMLSYQKNNINEFKSIFQINRDNIMADSFIKKHIEDFHRNIKTYVLIKFIRPYTYMKISSIATELGIEENEVKRLLDSCFKNNMIRGKFDNETVQIICKAGHQLMDVWEIDEDAWSQMENIVSRFRSEDKKMGDDV